MGAAKMDKVAQKLEDCLSANQDKKDSQKGEAQNKAEPPKPAPLVAPLAKVFVNKQLDGVMDKLKEEGRDDMVEMIEKVDQAFKEGVKSKDPHAIETALEEAREASERLRLEGQSEEAAKMDKVAQKLEDCLSVKQDKKDSQKGEAQNNA